MHLKIGYPFNSVYPQEPLSHSEVTAFCGSNKYQANGFSANAKDIDYSEYFDDLIAEKHPETSISLYPNPARSEITLTAYGGDLISITIYDLAGRPVIQATPGSAGNEYRVDINKLPSGIYLLQVTCGEKVHSEKLVVAR